MGVVLEIVDGARAACSTQRAQLAALGRMRVTLDNDTAQYTGTGSLRFGRGGGAAARGGGKSRAGTQRKGEGVSGLGCSSA